MKSLIWFYAVFVVALTIRPADAGVIESTFDTNDEAWLIRQLEFGLANPQSPINTFTPTFQSSGGNPDGYIEFLDDQDGWCWFAAPAPFLGNQEAAFKGQLAFDLQTTVNDGMDYPVVALISPTDALYFAAPPPGMSWTSYTVPLSTNGWKLNDYQTGLEPNANEMKDVLANLTAMYINGDWISGIETSGLDNVRMIFPIPEPSSLVILMTAAICMGCVSSFRRTKSIRKRSRSAPVTRCRDAR